MEEAFRARLLASSGVTALCGTRIDWGSRAQGALLPAIALHGISGAENYHLKGPDGLLQARVQVDCWAMSYGSAKALSRAVLASLSGYRGGNFRGVFHEATRDDRESGTNEATRPFRTSLDFNVNWKGTV
ncbi:MAG: DUF3168 domain-containing protein [Cypionkella sp.]|nr:DUF3168 domain-containing protein [Cypionkella sp.]